MRDSKQSAAEQAPRAEGTDAFLSYSRRDRGFVEWLHAQLERRGKEIYVDWNDIPAWSRDYEADLEAAIAGAGTFLFVLSPDSLESPNCRRELEVAVAGGKRIRPVLHRAVAANDVPPALRRPQWVDLGPRAGGPRHARGRARGRPGGGRGAHAGARARTGVGPPPPRAEPPAPWERPSVRRAVAGRAGGEGPAADAAPERVRPRGARSGDASPARRLRRRRDGARRRDGPRDRRLRRAQPCPPRRVDRPLAGARGALARRADVRRPPRSRPRGAGGRRGVDAGGRGRPTTGARAVAGGRQRARRPRRDCLRGARRRRRVRVPRRQRRAPRRRRRGD